MLKILHVVAEKKGYGINSSVSAQIDSLKTLSSGEIFIYEASSIVNYFYALVSLFKKIKNNRYDLIHAHYSRSGYLALLVSCEIPVVVSFMGTDLLGKSKVNKYIKNFLEKRTAHQIVKSPEMMNHLVDKSKTSIVPNGVDFDMFKPIPIIEAKKMLGLNSNLKYILFAADPSRKEKNYELAESAIKLVKSKYGTDVELITVYNEAHEKISLYMNACDIVLLTSVFEGSPNVIKEAMACNCSIVSTDVGDVKVLFQEVEGCCIAQSTPEDISQKIMAELSSKEENNGREKIRHLKNNLIAEEVFQIYLSVISR
jgi:glycosyltransferase involved in cell wall biosynthesis